MEVGSVKRTGFDNHGAYYVYKPKFIAIHL